MATRKNTVFEYEILPRNTGAEVISLFNDAVMEAEWEGVDVGWNDWLKIRSTKTSLILYFEVEHVVAEEVSEKYEDLDDIDLYKKEPVDFGLGMTPPVIVDNGPTKESETRLPTAEEAGYPYTAEQVEEVQEYIKEQESEGDVLILAGDPRDVVTDAHWSTGNRPLSEGDDILTFAGDVSGPELDSEENKIVEGIVNFFK